MKIGVAMEAMEAMEEMELLSHREQFLRFRR
jgi:hypothetical protein